MKLRMALALLSATLLSAGCATAPIGPHPAAVLQQHARSIVGAWEVTSQRTRGIGKNLLTFSSDGTFFRSGDTHPVLSGAHGAWRQVAPGVYEATYVAFAFDASGRWSGINRNNLQIRLDEGGDTFRGTVKTSNRDLQDNVLSSGTSTLEGRRIKVEPFH